MPKKGFQKVSFTALKTVKKPVRVEFGTKHGRVSFPAVQKVRKSVKVEFYTKNTKK